VLSAPVDAVSSFARNDISQLYLTLTKGGYAEGRALTLARQKPLPRNVMEAHEQVVSTLPRDERFVFCLFGHVEGIGKMCSLGVAAPRRSRPSAQPPAEGRGLLTNPHQKKQDSLQCRSDTANRPGSPSTRKLDGPPTQSFQLPSRFPWPSSAVG
jgi:hypothetical protein